jgi:hypothetical protein
MPCEIFKHGRWEQMKLSRWLSIAWVVVACLLVAMSAIGGDATIVSGLLWLVWTAPVGLIWQFMVYEHVLRIWGTEATNWVGLALDLVGAFLFWFHFIPWLFRSVRRRSAVSK